MAHTQGERYEKDWNPSGKPISEIPGGWRYFLVEQTTPGPEEQRAIDEGRREDTFADMRRELKEEIAHEEALQVKRALARAKRPSPTAVMVRRERARARPREHRQTRRRATRAGPKSDPSDSDPPRRPRPQAAAGVALSGTRRWPR